MDERLARVGRAAWWLLGIVLVVAVIGVVAWYFRVIFPPLVFAGALVFLLNPVVSFLERRGWPRLLGATAAYFLVALVFAGLGAILYPLIASQADDVSERWPELRRDTEEWINDLSERSETDDWPVHIPSVEELEDAGSSDDQELSEQVQTLREFGTQAFHIGIIFILGPFLAFYLLIDLPDVRRRIEELIPTRSREEVLFLAHRLNLAIGGFFRGQLAVAFIVGVMASIGLKAVVNLPLWLVVGMIAGVFNMIPLIGPWVGAVPGIAVALATKDVKAALGVALVMLVVQQIDNHLITPTVMRRAVQLHPAAVMMALLAWGTVGGFFGLLLAVPLTATFKIVGGHLWRKWVVGISIPGLDGPYPDRPQAAREDLPDPELPAAEADEAAAAGVTPEPG
jgi:predicted PurR-regulated permease PerM